MSYYPKYSALKLLQGRPQDLQSEGLRFGVPGVRDKDVPENP